MAQTESDQILITINEAAEKCRVSRGTIDRWHRDIPAFPRKIIIGGGSARFSLNELNAWLNSCPRQD